jgi:hypothetical protein
LTSTLFGSVDKSRSGIAAGVLNSTRQTGSVLGVALFGWLIGQASAFMAGTHGAGDLGRRPADGSRRDLARRRQGCATVMRAAVARHRRHNYGVLPRREHHHGFHAR